MTRFLSPRFGWTALAAIVVTVGVTQSVAAQGLDRVRDRNGTSSGKITKMSALGVTLSKGGVDTKKPVEEIESITFAGEPEELAPARRDASAGRYEKLVERLAPIDLRKIERPEIQQEIAFLRMLGQVEMALAGQGALEGALDAVKGFLAKNSKSYRVPAAIELLGNVLMAQQEYEGARTQYAKLGKARAPYFKARSAVLTGHAYQAEGKHAEALAAYQQAIQAAASNTIAQSQILEATLRLGVSQSALGDVATATRAIEQIIRDASDTRLLAKAYLALGDCYLQTQQPKAACQAFLHIDLLFSAASTEHAQALYELSRLWDDLGHPDRARDARERLGHDYPESRWARP